MAFLRQKCRVNLKYGDGQPNGCPYNHAKHYCKVCGDLDADHRSTNCPSQRCRVYAKYGNAAPKGCPYNHTAHYCKNCGNMNADHRSDYCPTLNQQKRCRVFVKYGGNNPKGCPYHHQAHKCKHCGDKDADHRSTYCPKIRRRGYRVPDCNPGIELCHGTKMENMPGISRDGLFPSKSGRLGPGIYFTEEQYAKQIAKYRGNGKGQCVIYCMVNLGRMKDVGSGHDLSGSWANNGYDSCKAQHPNWAGINHSFPEYCLKNKTKCKIRKVELVDVVINGDINLPNAKIVLKGRCKFKGRVIAGTLETQ